MADLETVQVVGDGIDGRWVTWRWMNGFLPGGVAEVTGLDRAAARLARALPRDRNHLGFEGELNDPRGEQELMEELGRVLLPDELRAQLLNCASDRIPLCVRVAPAPAAATVPWGLLAIAEHRLLDIADVSWIAPVLPRDLSAVEQQPSWDEARSKPALYVIDPVQRLGRVLRPADRMALVAEMTGTVILGSRYGAADLSSDLQSGVSRLFLLGHVLAGEAVSGNGFVLSDLNGAWPDSLTAEELIREPSTWPMPPRVAVIACASGVDMADHEPFGLATALLHNGAETVQATLWTLPTDHALATQDALAEPALRQLAAAINQAQAALDPVAALCGWQRTQLIRWRQNPSLSTSPLLWGAALTMTAPRRLI
jgi:hypothetical protein